MTDDQAVTVAAQRLLRGDLRGALLLLSAQATTDPGTGAVEGEAAASVPAPP